LLWLLVYPAVRAGLDLLVLRAPSDRSKDVEILVLRYELRVLRRRWARPATKPADPLTLAALSRVLPRERWGAFR
jgi:putative transposase